VIEIDCQRCGGRFTAQRSTRKWCDVCQTRVKDTNPRVLICGTCEAPFGAERDIVGRGRRYCTPECSVAAARKSRTESRKRIANGEPRRYGGRPPLLTAEDAAKRKREGVQARWFRKNPHRKRECEACGEARVVELAHKTWRNGAWRSLANTGPDDVWVLCPTCHRVLDYGIQTVDELGLTR
jgi:hypothetical protein